MSAPRSKSAKNCGIERATWSSGQAGESYRLFYDDTVKIGRDPTAVAGGYNGNDIEFDKIVSKAMRIEKWRGQRRLWWSYAAQLCVMHSGPCYLSFPTGLSTKSPEALLAEPTYQLELRSSDEPVDFSWITTILTYVPSDKNPRYLALADVGSIYYSLGLIVNFDIPPGPEREREQTDLRRLSLPEVFVYAKCRKR